ncbi:hypothetical protein [Halobaculum magnesiiphilum]|uniref:DUF8014 domain-containing protein n=1 Tax=Halobaculum magnesiiphilum TaxID=1017351 RepID=A0A8T8WDA1_9EURY|nr:hypothetical protein [Halobaculum magnesiiphilum]QZP37852.1 hypothetical protein K6T50_01350 [Halobaculum magnesiiphilum]
MAESAGDGGDEKQCAEEGCTREAAVRLYVPWEADRDVCAAHGRVLAQRDGVVAEPLPGDGNGWG